MIKKDKQEGREINSEPAGERERERGGGGGEKGRYIQRIRDR